jgi:integrase
VFVRSGELRNAEWKEIDFNARLWRRQEEKIENEGTTSSTLVKTGDSALKKP